MILELNNIEKTPKNRGFRCIIVELDYLEENSYLLPVRFVLNHGIHLNFYISKLPIGTGFITDFAYITKSSIEWRIVLVEIEDSKKKFFNKNGIPTSDFIQARDQVLGWKSYIEDKGKNYVLEALNKLLVPEHMSINPVNFKYLLIYGRTEELIGNDKQLSKIQQYKNENFDIITYDSLISQCETGAYQSPRMIISIKDINKIIIKQLPNTEFNTPIFSYINHYDLHLTENQINYFKQQGYCIDDWMQGKQLVVNDKYPKNNRYSLLKINQLNENNIQPS